VKKIEKKKRNRELACCCSCTRTNVVCIFKYRRFNVLNGGRGRQKKTYKLYCLKNSSFINKLFSFLVYEISEFKLMLKHSRHFVFIICARFVDVFAEITTSNVFKDALYYLPLFCCSIRDHEKPKNMFFANLSL
jgi:hypothetical protein